MFPSRTKPEIQNIHASCVAAGNGGVLILGNPGQGKSDLALRLIDRGARLVADDRCDIWFDRERLWCRPPETLAGKERQAFRAGFLGIGSFGWSTLAVVTEASAEERAAYLEKQRQYSQNYRAKQAKAKKRKRK